MMNADPQSISAHDFSQFTPNMESIKDQQMTGLMAQQAGQVVVPASNSAGRNTATPQPGNQNIPNQQVQNQTPRAGQQQQQPQQAKLNQAAQQSQALQAQAQMKMQNQQIGPGMATSQSPGMNTLNTPVTRPGGINPMGPQGMAQAGVQFGDQRFHQGIQRPNNAAFNAMLANMTPEQRQAINGLPQEKLTEVLRRWQSQRQEQMQAMNGGNPMMQQQMANRPPNQFGPMGANVGPGPQAMPQGNGTGVGNQQQAMQMGRMGPPQGPQLALLMDSMDLPPNIINQITGLPVEVKKWRDLKAWITQNNNNVQPHVRNQLLALQQKQFQVLMQRRAGNLPQQPGQALNMNPNMPMQMAANQQANMQRPMPGNIPPQLLQVSAQEMMHIRSQKPGLVNVPDDQLRNMILQMKRTSWQQQQQSLRVQQVQAAQLQANQQQPTPNHMPGVQGPMMLQQQPQPNLTPQTQAQTMPNAMSQTASMQANNQKQQPNANQNQTRNNQSQPPKNLKRPNPDDSADTASAKAPTPAARPAAVPPQPAQQPIQRMGPKFNNFTPLTPQQEASLTPEQRARYEQILKNHGKVPAANTGAAGDSLNRLKLIGQEEQRQFSQEQMVDIPMGPEEYAETAQKLKRIVSDMSKVGRGLSKWYAITQDDARAKMFFRTVS